MTTLLTPMPPAEIVYPESDGKRMADNTEQARWIFVLFGNLQAMLADILAFVAADLMWYAKEGFPEECEAPDVFVAFGRPKGKRPSYKQWEEGDVGPQVVFEILSPGNTPQEMERKDAFYSEYGVEEYYIYDPEKNSLEVYLRQGSVLRRKWFRQEFVSPLLGIKFDFTGEEMQVFSPDGRRFLNFVELEAERARERQLRLDAEEKLQTTEEKLQTAEEKLQTTEEKLQTAEDRLARLSELSRKVVQQNATAEEIAELRRLLGSP